MRVISGTARGTKLKLVPGDTTRPIMDRVKESLFNIIGQDVYDSVWLDMFAGTGQVGIEALSRGADHVIFLDMAKAAVRTIHQNLAATKVKDRATVTFGDAFAYLRQAVQQDKPAFDFIYIAPPQYKDMWKEALNIVEEGQGWILHPEGQIIIQIDPKEYEEIQYKRFELVDKREYGRTLLCFYEKSKK